MVSCAVSALADTAGANAAPHTPMAAAAMVHFVRMRRLPVRLLAIIHGLLAAVQRHRDRAADDDFDDPVLAVAVRIPRTVVVADVAGLGLRVADAGDDAAVDGAAADPVDVDGEPLGLQLVDLLLRRLIGARDGRGGERAD